MRMYMYLQKLVLLLPEYKRLHIYLENNRKNSYFRIQNELFSQVPTGDRYFQSPNGKMWSPKSVNKTFPLQRNTGQINCHDGLASKIFAIDVIRNQTVKPVLKSSFKHFDRSTLPPFDAQRIS